jgi:hypothetical protein
LTILGENGAKRKLLAIDGSRIRDQLMRGRMRGRRSVQLSTVP